MLNFALEAHEALVKGLGGRQVKVHIPVSAFNPGRLEIAT